MDTIRLFSFLFLKEAQCDLFHVLFLYTTNVGLSWYTGSDRKADADAGYLSTKVICLIESLLEYRFG